MLLHIPDERGSEPARTRRVLVVFESQEARDHLLRTVEELADPARLGWEVYWCHGASLRDREVEVEATNQAATADLVVFVISPSGELGPETRLWIERWVARRSEREGAIVGVVHGASAPGEMACLKEIYLRHTALRAGMDYLSHIPVASQHAIPDSIDSCSNRAVHVSAVLDEILRTLHPPAGPMKD